MDSLVGEESTCPCVHLWSRDHHQEKEPPSPPAGLNLVLCLFLISFSQRKPPSFQMLQAPWKSGFASVLSEEELKSLLMKVKEESEKVGLKLYIQKMKIMASGPIASWEIDGETVETVSDFIFLGSKITVDGDCSHEIIRRLLLEIKARQHIKKQRHYFANKGPSSQGYGFSWGHVWM